MTKDVVFTSFNFTDSIAYPHILSLKNNIVMGRNFYSYRCIVVDEIAMTRTVSISLFITNCSAVMNKNIHTVHQFYVYLYLNKISIC